MTRSAEQQACPHCGAEAPGPPEFCPACGRRLTSVHPEGIMHRIARALGLVRAPLSEQQRAYASQLYRKGPSNHGGEGA